MTHDSSPVDRIAAIRALLIQFFSYGLSGGTATATQFSVLYFLVQIGCEATPASAIAYACGVPVNYGLQHRFVFKRVGEHGSFFPRYLAVSLSTLVLNTLIFCFLEQGLGIFYFASQVITTAIIVPGRFMLNRHVTFRTSARPIGCVRQDSLIAGVKGLSGLS